MTTNGDSPHVDWALTEMRLDILRDLCGDLCDTAKSVSKDSGDFMGSITAKIDCPKLSTLLEKLSDSSFMLKPAGWKDIPLNIKRMSTFNDRQDNLHLSHHFYQI